MTERTLARIVLIDDIIPHPNADMLEIAVVGGWQCIVKKGEFSPKMKAIYVEVDAAVPLGSRAFEFLEGRNNVTLDDKRYARIKTIKLRKELSQGLVIPVDFADGDEGVDVTEALGIVKYEKPEERERNATGVKTGVSSLGFPKFIPKTDQNRVQNIVHMYNKAVQDEELFEATYKLDGSSLTAYCNKGVLGVCSRNVGFRMADEKRGFFATLKEFVFHVKQRGFKNAKWTPVIKADDNSFTQMAIEAELDHAVTNIYLHTGRSVALQGEMVGPAIQKNFEGVEKNSFFLYDIYDIDKQEYLLPEERQKMAAEFGIPHVPVWSARMKLPELAQIIADADGPSGLNGKYREGLVFKSTVRDFSFKVISNRYLIDED